METGECSFDIATTAEGCSSDRTIGMNEAVVGIRAHLTERTAARAREDVWFDAQDRDASHHAWPQQIPAADLNPVLLHVWPVRT